MRGPPLMRGLNVHKNIHVSITKLTLGLRVGFISSHLIADKLFQINPRTITGPSKMSLLLEAKSKPALIIKPRFILIMHTDDLGWYITSNQQGEMFVQNLNRIVRKPNVTRKQFSYCTTDNIPIDLMYRAKFSYSHTSLELPESSKWLPTAKSDLSYLSVLQQQPELSILLECNPTPYRYYFKTCRYN